MDLVRNRLEATAVYHQINTHGPAGKIGEVLRQSDCRMDYVRDRRAFAGPSGRLWTDYSRPKRSRVRRRRSVAYPEIFTLGEAPLCPAKGEARRIPRAAHRYRGVDRLD